MPKPYSVDLRERVVNALKTKTKQEVAEAYGVSLRTVHYWDARQKATGNLVPDPWGGGRPPKLTESQHAAMLAAVDKTPDITLEELQQSLSLPVSVATICMRLIKEGYSFKKRRFMPVNATDPMSRKSAGSSKKKSKGSRSKT